MYSSGNDLVSVLLDNFADGISLLLESSGLLLFALVLGLLNCFDSLGSLSGLSGVDLSNSLVSSLNNLLFLLLDILINCLVDLGLTLELLHFISKVSLFSDLLHGLGLVGGGDGLDHLGVWGAS